MKVIRQFNLKTDAHLTCQLLESHGIQAQVRGSREYTTHLLGGDAGFFELLVDERQEQEALTVLKDMEQAPEDNSPTMGEPGFYIKRAVVFAVLASVVFPVIFHYASLKNLMIFRRLENKTARRELLTALIILLQLPGLVVAYFIAGQILGSN